MEVHKHHKVPKYMGGSDEPDNLIHLSRYEHSIEHLKLYYQFGNKQDLCAYYMLKADMEKFRPIYASLGGEAIQKKRKAQGLNSYGLDPYSDKMLETCSRNGKIQGSKNRDSGHMLKIRELANLSEAGKKGAEVCRAAGTNAFFDETLRTEIARKGGQVQGKKNTESGHLDRIRKLPRKYKGTMWITNGIDTKMILKTEEIPDGYRKGRTIKRAEV